MANTKKTATKKPAPRTRDVKPKPVESGQEPVSKLPRATRPGIKVLAGVALVILLGAGVWSYLNQKSLVESLKDPNKSEEVIRDELVKEVRKIAVIPEDEKPLIIEVKNLSDLQDQPFYALAEEGDRVLLYAEAKRAILYRPSTNQIVNISNNIVLEDSSQPQTENEEPTVNQPEQ